MKKKITMLFLLTLGTISYIQAQNGNGVGIGKALPDASAMLDVSGQYNKGVLLPKVELTNLTTFKLEGDSMTEGMIVYNTNATLGTGFYFWVKEKLAVGSEPPVLAHWEKITDQTTVDMLDKRITKIEVDITNITGGGSANLSYLIRFRPKADPDKKDEMFYLKPLGTTPETYEEIRIDRDIVTSFESKTDVGKQVFSGDAWNAVVKATVLPADSISEKGEIVYNYKSEVDSITKQPVHYYMNLTKDIIEAVTNSENLKTEITNVIKNEGGNVYYGAIKGDTIKVFYEWVVDPVDPTKKTQQEISIKDIVINNFSTIIKNPSVVTELETIIKETTKVVVEKGKDKETGETIDGKPVYKGMASGTINLPAAEFPGFFTVKPFEFILDSVTKEYVLKAVVDPKIGRLVSVKVLKEDGSVVMSTATDVLLLDDTFNFAFGVGNMYTPIEAGTYDVMFEYTLK